MDEAIGSLAHLRLVAEGLNMIMNRDIRRSVGSWCRAFYIVTLSLFVLSGIEQ
jgi:hypothetical protein